MLHRGMDRAQFDAAYNDTAAVPDRDAIIADWEARSAKVRLNTPAISTLPTGMS